MKALDKLIRTTKFLNFFDNIYLALHIFRYVI